MLASPVRSLSTSKTPKLLFIQHTSILENFGGVEYYLDDMASLAKDLYGKENVSVVAMGKDATKGETRGYPISVIPRSPHGFFRKIENRFSPRLFRNAVYAAKTFRPDYLVCSHVSLGPLVQAVSRWIRTPYLSFVYGIEAWGDLWPQDEWSLKNSDAIISISHWTKRLLVERGYSASQIQIVHPRLPAGMEEKEKRKAGEARPFTLLTVSRLDARERYKGQDHVLAALALLTKRSPSFEFRYIIQGEGTDQERLREMVKSYKLEGKVEFRGAVRDRLQLEESYRSCDAYIMPSRFGRWEGSWKGEGFGIVYLEAAAVGVPSIAYRCGGALDIIRHEENGLLVSPDDITGLADAILRLGNDRKLLERLGQSAYQSVNTSFTQKPIRAEFQKALEEIYGIASSSSK